MKEARERERETERRGESAAMSRNVVFPFSSLEVRWIPVLNDVLSDSCYLGRGEKKLKFTL